MSIGWEIICAAIGAKPSLSGGADNRQLIIERSINSARLALVALLLSVPLSLALGIIAGLFENKWPDALISLLTLSVVSLPEFVTGLFLINIVALGWGRGSLAEALGWWFPASSAVPANASFGEMLPALWLPAIAATLVLLAYISRLTRAGVIEELKRDYVRTAVLKGIPYRSVIVRHVLRNALMPTVTVIAISITWLISGLVVIEFVFGFPRFGQSVDRRHRKARPALGTVYCHGLRDGHSLYQSLCRSRLRRVEPAHQTVVSGLLDLSPYLPKPGP